MPEPLLGLGVRLYNQLGLCASSYRDWFAEGAPHEWVRALDAIQQTLLLCKRQAQQAAREAPAAAPGAAPGALPLFAREEPEDETHGTGV